MSVYLIGWQVDFDRLESGLHLDLDDIIASQNESTVLGQLLHAITQSLHADDMYNIHLNTGKRIIQIYAGSILSGAPFHSHGAAMNVLLYGQKLWTLLPPSRDIYSSIHPVMWERMLVKG